MSLVTSLHAALALRRGERFEGGSLILHTETGWPVSIFFFYKIDELQKAPAVPPRGSADCHATWSVIFIILARTGTVLS